MSSRTIRALLRGNIRVCHIVPYPKALTDFGARLRTSTGCRDFLGPSSRKRTETVADAIRVELEAMAYRDGLKK